MEIRPAAALAVALLLAACGGPDVAAEQEALRAPDNVQQKTAEILEVADLTSITVTDIHLREADAGSASIVEWSARTPAGDFACNADVGMAHPVCDQVRVANGQPTAVEVAAEQAEAAATAAFNNSAGEGAVEDMFPPEP
jgi:hypothetical protein